MKLIILGNGFDLNHKYKTSFNDFKSYLKKSKLEEEQLLVKQIDQLIKDRDKNGNIQWNNFEEIIGHRLDPSFQFRDMKGVNIYSLIEKFTEKFHFYISNLIKTKEFNINPNLIKEFEDFTSIISFNYTSFYTNYLKDNSENNVFHIHGDMSENNLPIIGFYYEKISGNNSSTDYSIKYSNRLIHKSALAFKQNEKNLDLDINQYANELKGKISEIVIMGYSFGESDSHIYKILNKIMIWQNNDKNIPVSKSKEIRVVKIKIYSFDDIESEKIIKKIKNNFMKMERVISTNITGVGFSSKIKDLVTFELVKY